MTRNYQARRSLKPGDMFAVESYPGLYQRLLYPDVYVVIDEKREVGFWSGAQSVLGDIGPAIAVLKL